MIITQNHIEVNKYSRPGDKLLAVLGLVVHWTADPGATAQNERDYFNSLAKQPEGNPSDRSASAQYAIGMEGEIIEMIPPDEVAYHCGAKSYKKTFGPRSPNNYTIGIECCIPDATGKLTEETYASLVSLLKKLLADHPNLSSADIWRHFDITGKDCPKWYVDYPSDWDKLKEDVDGQ